MNIEDKELVALFEGLDTPGVSDALDKLGLPGQCLGVAPLDNYSKVIVGPAFTVQYLGRRETQVEMGLEDEPNYGQAPGRVEAEFYRVVARGSDPLAAPDRSQVLLQATLVRE